MIVDHGSRCVDVLSVTDVRGRADGVDDGDELTDCGDADVLEPVSDAAGAEVSGGIDVGGCWLTTGATAREVGIAFRVGVGVGVAVAEADVFVADVVAGVAEAAVFVGAGAGGAGFAATAHSDVG
jgi:hypothetical protein